jgi:hypothetical protein
MINMQESAHTAYKIAAEVIMSKGALVNMSNLRTYNGLLLMAVKI